MVLRAIRFGFCCVISSLLLVAPAAAADVLDQPRELCDYFESLGMKTQFRWGPSPRGNAYFCQYADEFGGDTRHVRGARVYVDPDSGKVGLGLSLQGFQLVRGEAIDAMQAFATDFFQAQRQPVPEGLAQVIAADEEQTRSSGGFELGGYGGALWERQRVVGFSLSRPADAALLASLGDSVTPAERAHQQQVQDMLLARCQRAVAASGKATDTAALKSEVTPLSASRILVRLADGQGTFSCQACDDTDPGVNCGVMGLQLSYAGADGQSLTLPAELDRKCAYFLQKELSTATDGSFIDHALVKRITTREVPNEKRYVYEHELDGQAFRCVIRKSDLNFQLDRRDASGEWRGMVAGIML